MTFRNLLAALCALALPGCSKPADEPTPPVKQPNIVLLFVDDLGWTGVGYQDGQWDTPHIDRLRTQSMRFSRAYAASPTCSPSRASVITGRHPARLRLVRHIPGRNRSGFDELGRTKEEFHTIPGDPLQFPSRNWLPLEETTIAEALGPLGYRTGFVGKWHLGSEDYHPIHQGFDEQHGVTNFGNPRNYNPPYWPQGNPYPDAERYLTDRLTDDAVSFLEDQSSEKPFFLSLFYYSVHTPHDGRADLVEKYEARGVTGRMAHFAAMHEAMDESVGRILATLDERGFADDTMVVFFSDQGGYFSNAPLRGGKTGGMALYEGGARVPLLVRWPNRVKPGSESAEPMVSTDLFPTFVEAAGGDPADFQPLDGRSLLPALEGGKLDRESIVLYRHYEDLYAAVLAGRWKLIASVAGAHQLYDLETDPAEDTDLAARKPEKLADMLEILRKFQDDTAVAPRPEL